MRQRPKTGLVFSAVFVTLGLVGWLYLAPQQLGGSASYAVLHGTSMEPDLHRGDLAIVRDANAYDVGDVVLYHDPALGINVLHRIVGLAGGRFLLKGDNNGFKDSVRPVESQIRGQLWLRVPVAGRIFGWARTPLNAALLAAAATLLLLGGGVRGAGSGRRSVPIGGGRRSCPSIHSTARSCSHSVAPRRSLRFWPLQPTAVLPSEPPASTGRTRTVAHSPTRPGPRRPRSTRAAG